MASEARALTGRGVEPGSRFGVGRNGTALLAGIGPERARTGAGELVAAGARGLMSWGIAGGLSADAPMGQLLVPQEICRHPDTQAVLQTDAAWAAALSKSIAPVARADGGRMVQTDIVVARPAEKRQLAVEAGAVAVDMESFAVAEVAHAAGLPFVAVRVIADDRDGEVPSLIFGVNDAWGRPRWGRLLPRLATGPHRVGALLRLRRSFSAALAVLALVAQTRALERAWDDRTDDPVPTSPGDPA